MQPLAMGTPCSLTAVPQHLRPVPFAAAAGALRRSSAPACAAAHAGCHSGLVTAIGPSAVLGGLGGARQPEQQARAVAAQAGKAASKGFGATKTPAVSETCPCGSKLVYRVSSSRRSSSSSLRPGGMPRACGVGAL